MEAKGRLNVSGPFETTDVRVFDADWSEVAAGTHAITKELAPGIYRVVAQVPGSRAEKLAVVEAGKGNDRRWIHARLGFDHAPRADAVARRISIRSRGEDQQAEPRGSRWQRTALHLRPHLRRGLRRALPSFTLRDRTGVACASFPAMGEHDATAGWLACSLKLPAGTYQLEHQMPEMGLRDQAIFVDNHWQTQAFVPWREVPRFEAAVLHMRPASEGFDPKKFWAFAQTEAALDGLAHGRVILQPEEITGFLHGKFDDPMLGLIGAYALVVQPDINYDLLKVVANNLCRLMPHSPDAQLLDLVALDTRQYPTQDAGGGLRRVSPSRRCSPWEWNDCSALPRITRLCVPRIRGWAGSRRHCPPAAPGRAGTPASARHKRSLTSRMRSPEGLSTAHGIVRAWCKK